MSGGSAVIPVGQFFSALLTLWDRPGIPGNWQVCELGTKKGTNYCRAIFNGTNGTLCVFVCMCECPVPARARTHTAVHGRQLAGDNGAVDSD